MIYTLIFLILNVVCAFICFGFALSRMKEGSKKAIGWLFLLACNVYSAVSGTIELFEQLTN